MDELNTLQEFQELMLSNDNAEIAEQIREAAIEWLKNAKAKQIGRIVRTMFMSLTDEAFEQFKAL